MLTHARSACATKHGWRGLTLADFHAFELWAHVAGRPKSATWRADPAGFAASGRRRRNEPSVASQPSRYSAFACHHALHTSYSPPSTGPNRLSTLARNAGRLIPGVSHLRCGCETALRVSALVLRHTRLEDCFEKSLARSRSSLALDPWDQVILAIIDARLALLRSSSPRARQDSPRRSTFLMNLPQKIDGIISCSTSWQGDYLFLTL